MFNIACVYLELVLSFISCFLRHEIVKIKKERAQCWALTWCSAHVLSWSSFKRALNKLRSVEVPWAGPVCPLLPLFSGPGPASHWRVGTRGPGWLLGCDRNMQFPAPPPIQGSGRLRKHQNHQWWQPASEARTVGISPSLVLCPCLQQDSRTFFCQTLQVWLLGRLEKDGHPSCPMPPFSCCCISH
jgi:hypothetical protein